MRLQEKFSPVAPNAAPSAASSAGYVLLHAIVACLTAVRPARGAPTGLDHHARRPAPDPALLAARPCGAAVFSHWLQRYRRVSLGVVHASFAAEVHCQPAEHAARAGGAEAGFGAANTPDVGSDTAGRRARPL
jgi:hypothetical protein